MNSTRKRTIGGRSAVVVGMGMGMGMGMGVEFEVIVVRKVGSRWLCTVGAGEPIHERALRRVATGRRGRVGSHTQ